LLTSVTSALASYALTRLHDVRSPTLRCLIRTIATSAAMALEFIRADECAMLDNLPFSTILHKPFNEIDLQKGIEAARSIGQRRVVIRGLNDIEHQDHLRWLAKSNFVSIPYRRVFLVADPAAARGSSRVTRRELRLLGKFSGNSLCLNLTLSNADVDLVTSMYRDLYFNRYSTENADYSSSFVRHALDVGFLQSLTLKDKRGEIGGFLGFYEDSLQIAAPMIGWSREYARSIPIYRILMIEIFRHALETGKQLNWSSGVSKFRTLRGATPALEYLSIEPGTNLQRGVYAALAAIYGYAASKSTVMGILKT
jgi:hypothetical protein